MRPNRKNGALRRRSTFGAIAVTVALLGVTGIGAVSARAAGDTVDEIHYSFGNTSDSVVFDWHGAEQTIYYGADTNYGSSATAAPSAVTPVDSAGPFQEVALTGLVPATTYHYKIGTDGLDHSFNTVPTGDFTWVDIGDTSSTDCHPWVAGTHSLVAAQAPNFVTHGGDISYANECGTQAVHQYYVDQQVWSNSAAFQPVWGNHEYGPPNSDSVPGAIRDSMANYKGRSYITNAQTVPNDLPSQVNNPGCGWETHSPVNTCQGEDWGWFRAGRVLYISYPELWYGAVPNWGPRADSLMAAAQADPSVDFIITYGHRPAYTSVSGGQNNDVRTAVNQLAVKYSPTATNPNGKYVLNVAHHIHGEEAFSPINGLVNLTNGGGGAGQTGFSVPPDPHSIFRTVHPGLLAAKYNATLHSLNVSLLCGPDFTPNVKEPCTYGSVLYSQSFSRPDPTAPVVNTAISDGATSVQPGQQVTYNVSVSSPSTSGSQAAGVVATATVPTNATIVDGAGGTVTPGAGGTGGTVVWNVGTLDPGQTVPEQLTVQVAGGTSLPVNVQTTTTDVACSTPGSSCSATDTDSVAVPPPPTKEWVTNPSVESSLSGWGGKYGPSPLVTVAQSTTTAHDGLASIKVTGLTGAKNLQSGFNDNPRWVLSTAVGTTYTQVAWVDPTFVGQRLYLRLREWNGNTLVVDKVVNFTATSVGWQPLTQQLTALRTGDSLSFAVAGLMSAGQSFYADAFSLTSPS